MNILTKLFNHKHVEDVPKKEETKIDESKNNREKCKIVFYDVVDFFKITEEELRYQLIAAIQLEETMIIQHTTRNRTIHEKYVLTLVVMKRAMCEIERTYKRFVFEMETPKEIKEDSKIIVKYYDAKTDYKESKILISVPIIHFNSANHSKFEQFF